MRDRKKIFGVSVAPLGLGIHDQRQPTAHAVGYHLSALRAWDGGRVIRGVGRVGRTALRAWDGRGLTRGVWIGRARGAEHRQMIAHGVSRGLRRERDPAPEGRKIPGGLGSVAPLGLRIHTVRPPTAHAVGYCLSALRA